MSPRRVLSVVALAVVAAGSASVGSADAVGHAQVVRVASAASDGADWVIGRPPANAIAVSCWSQTGCVALSSSLGAWQWDGTSWTTQQSGPKAPGGKFGSILESIACTGPSMCQAVGQSGIGNGFDPLIETWDGTKWRMVEDRDSALYSNLAGVACTGPENCWAVGFIREKRSQVDGTLIDHWTGSSWQRVSAPDGPRALPAHGGIAGFRLESVSCAGASMCLAVADANDLGLAWDGQHWTVVPDSTGDGISCVSPQFCMDVSVTLRDHTRRWNGTAWVTIPVTSPGNARLEDVACSSTMDCVAAGYRIPKGAANPPPYAQSWNGKRWQAVSGLKTAQVTVICDRSSHCVYPGQHPEHD
jgi:hypothetical protein